MRHCAALETLACKDDMLLWQFTGRCICNETGVNFFELPNVVEDSNLPVHLPTQCSGPILCPPDTRQRPLSPEARRVAYLGACPAFSPPCCLHLSRGKLPKRVCRKSQTIFSPLWGMNPFFVGRPKVSLTITCHKCCSGRILTMSWIQMSPVPADLLLDSPLLTVGASIRRCCLVSGGHSTCKHRSTDNYNRHEM